MNKSIGFGVPVVVLLFMILSGDVSGQMQQQPVTPTIVVSQPASKMPTTTISFTTSELQSVDRDPSLVLKKIGYSAQRDCTAPYRISSCIWACRNNRKVRTCHPTLVRALERVWSRK